MIMGKDLKGKEIGRGLSQRADGRYMGRTKIGGEQLTLYDWDLRNLKRRLDIAVNEAKITSIKHGPGNLLTLNEWYEEWYAKYKAPVLKHGGSASYKRKFTNYYGARIGDKPLGQIRQMHVQAAIADMIEAGRSSKSIREATGILQNCIEAAIANGLMHLNPTVGVQVPKCDKVERRVLSVNEQEEFIDFLESTHHWFEELYKFMLLTGLRIGEVGGLLWEDIDFENRFIYVKRSLTYQYENHKKIMMFSSPKTENSVRKIPFFGETKEILLRQKDKLERRKSEVGYFWVQPEGMENLVFLTSRGTPIGRYSIESDMRNITSQLNMMRRTEADVYGEAFVEIGRLHPHALRHTFATRCFEKGMSPRTVQEIMGHANYNTTVSYTHVLDDMKQREAEIVGDFLNNKNNAYSAKSEYRDMLGIV